MATIIEVDYYNAFWTKKIYTGAPTVPGGAGSACYPGPVSYGDAVLGLGNVTAFGHPDFPVATPWVVVPKSMDQWPVWDLSGTGYPYGNSLIKHIFIEYIYNNSTVIHDINIIVKMPARRARAPRPRALRNDD